jgi:hypothetical protein
VLSRNFWSLYAANAFLPLVAPHDTIINNFV